MFVSCPSIARPVVTYSTRAVHSGWDININLFQDKTDLTDLEPLAVTVQNHLRIIDLSASFTDTKPAKKMGPRGDCAVKSFPVAGIRSTHFKRRLSGCRTAG